jgi:hypothetical protein
MQLPQPRAVAGIGFGTREAAARLHEQRMIKEKGITYEH